MLRRRDAEQVHADVGRALVDRPRLIAVIGAVDAAIIMHATR
jgi:hypothetical protein